MNHVQITCFMRINICLAEPRKLCRKQVGPLFKIARISQFSHDDSSSVGRESRGSQHSPPVDKSRVLALEDLVHAAGNVLHLSRGVCFSLLFGEAHQGSESKVGTFRSPMRQRPRSKGPDIRKCPVTNWSWLRWSPGIKHCFWDSSSQVLLFPLSTRRSCVQLRVGGVGSRE